MGERSVFEEVRLVLARVLKIDSDEIRPKSKLEDDLGMDSVDFFDVITTLDKKYGVRARVSEADAASIVTVSDLVKLIRDKAGVS